MLDVFQITYGRGKFIAADVEQVLDFVRDLAEVSRTKSVTLTIEGIKLSEEELAKVFIPETGSLGFPEAGQKAGRQVKPS